MSTKFKRSVIVNETLHIQKIRKKMFHADVSMAESGRMSDIMLKGYDNEVLHFLGYFAPVAVMVTLVLAHTFNLTRSLFRDPKPTK